MNKFLEYLWNRKFRTKFNLFGTYAASLLLLYLGYFEYSIFLLIGFVVFLILEVISLYSKYFRLILEHNGLKTDIYENTDEFWGEVIGE